MDNGIELTDATEITKELASLVGQSIVSLKPRVGSNGLSSFYLTVGDGREFYFDAIALHGMEAAIGLSKRNA